MLIIPTTIAATFALVREQTALAARLQQLSRMFLTLTTGILWLAVVISLIVLDGNSAKGSSTSHPGHEPQLIGGRGLPSTMEDGNGKGAKRGKEWITRQRADWRGEGS